MRTVLRFAGIALVATLMMGMTLLGPPSVHAQTGDFNFIAYGDTRGNHPASVSDLHDDIVNAFMLKEPEFVLHTGDMVNHGGEAYQWPFFNDSIAAIWEAGVPFYGVVGNHEHYTDDWGVNDEDFSTYLDYIDHSDVVNEAGETELHYSFDYESIHFIVVDTEDEFIDDTFNSSEAQMDWLLADLENTEPEEFIVAAFHRPAFSIRSDRWAQGETIRDEFHPIFSQYGVDLVFMGHDHFYYRANRDGISYVTTGGGGAPLYNPDMNTPTWQSGDVTFREYHYCNVEVNTTHVTTTVTTLNGTVLDSFSIEREDVPAAPPLGWTIFAVEGGIILILLVFLAFGKRN
ncbi:MAG: metallophosphoesterase family protein [Promethearchaeota archaeon]